MNSLSFLQIFYVTKRRMMYDGKGNEYDAT